MPLAVALATPEWIVVTCIRRLDAAGMIRASLGRDTTVLHLNIFARSRAVIARRCVSFSDRRSVRRRSMAIRHMVRRRSGCRRRTRRVDVSLMIAIARHGIVVAPLIRRVEVSKRVQRTVEAIVVVAAIVVHGVVMIVNGRIVAGAVIYPGVISTSCISAHYSSDAIVGVGDDAGWVGAVGLLAGVGEDAALAVARGVDVVVTGFWKRLHDRIDELRKRKEVKEMLVVVEWGESGRSEGG